MSTNLKTKKPLALYVHWPWCLSKCPYCDFNSHAVDGGNLDHAAHLAGILAELKHYAAKTPGRSISSVFFGGGTPSLMQPASVQAILETADQLWGFDANPEITLEANPTSIEAGKFKGFHKAGINRVSIGIQALNDEALRSLGREHSAAEALKALDIAQGIFDRYTFDIIYARPNQTPDQWQGELTQALKLAGSHLSLYQLTIEPGTAFFRSKVPEADPDLGADLYQITQELCTAAGLPAYEISNHARPGEESRHNLTYWQGGDYLGVGPGAHGRLTLDGEFFAHHQIADPARWLTRIKAKGHGTAKTIPLSKLDRMEETILAGLRLSSGIDRNTFKQTFAQDVADFVSADGLALLQDENLIKLDQQALTVTPNGRLVLGAILEKLLV